MSESDVVIAVRLYGPANYSCLIAPANAAEKICRKHGKNWIDTPKKNGQKRSENFPIFIHPERCENYGLSIEQYIDCWNLFR